MTPKDKAYNNVVIAIIQQAREDYKTAIKRGKTKKIEDLEDFFKSRWGMSLTYNNSIAILDEAKKEAEREMEEEAKEEEAKKKQKK